jgi:hypothetical protein
VFVNAPAYMDEMHYRCRCGSEAFAVTPVRVYCINCGANHKPWG